MLFTVLDIVLLALIAMVCWRGYRGIDPWLSYFGQWLGRLLHGKGFWQQLFTFGPMIVAWLLLCHRINTAGWHATAAGGILVAMTVGLDAMRSLEKQQKQGRKACEK